MIGTRASIAAEKATAAAVRGRSLTRAAAQRGDAASHPARRLSGNLSFAKLGETENLKTFLAAFVTLGILGFAALSAYQFAQGPTVEIVEGID